MLRTDNLPALMTRPLFTALFQVDAIRDVGASAGATRRIAPVTGGRFEGERLAGDVLGNGTDWQMVRHDGTIELDARILLRTHDGAHIAMAYTGLRHGPPDVMQRLAQGEDVAASDYYFRIQSNFSTSTEKYDWINRILAVGVGRRTPDGPLYSLHEVI